MSVAIDAAYAVSHALGVPRTFHCPIYTDRVVNLTSAAQEHRYVDFKGRRYFFCCSGCPEKFRENPSKYAASDSISIPPVAIPCPVMADRKVDIAQATANHMFADYQGRRY